MEQRKAFYKLCLSTLLAVYILILVGGIVRSTGSGMGCPDWPKCFGSWVPPTSVSELPEDYKKVYSEYRDKKNVRFARYLRVVGMGETADKILTDENVLVEADFNATKTWIEYLNRVVGVIIGLLIFAVFVTSLRFWRTDRWITILAFSTFFLVGFQGWIGSFVVSTNLTPWTVTVHMFLALVIVGQLILLLFWSREQNSSIEAAPKLRWWLIGCIALLLVQILLGTQVREAIDRVSQAVARTEWIEAIGGDIIIHRSFSWVILIAHAGLYLNLTKTTIDKTFSRALMVVILATILSGAGMAYFAVPAFLQPLHLLLATVCFGMQFMLLLMLSEDVKTPVRS